MIELNVKFQEKYKQLDFLCKDIFSSKDGVSKYISVMENTSPSYSRLVIGWEYIYKQLKHFRWIRNQLAHQVGAFDSDLCTDSDIQWLSDFYNSVLRRTDPLAKIGQIKSQNQNRPKNTVLNNTQAEKAVELSLWDKLKAKIKSWFS